MSDAKASILIPFKNTAAYLPACLDSIINQSYKNWEVLIVDDSSTDQSHEIVKAYSQQDARIRLLKNKGVGIIEALQTAFAQSTGTFITRMDSDDIMATNKIECMVADLTLKGAGYIALGLVHYFSESGIKEGYKRYENWLNTLISKGTNFNEIYKNSDLINTNKLNSVSVLFAGDKKIIELNSRYRKINLPTNVLSFPSFIERNKEIFLGDIIFSAETIFKEAKREKKSCNNHLIHLFYIHRR